MRVGIYQFSPAFGRVEKNLLKIEAALKGCEADLILMPELCTTGYQFLSSAETALYAEGIPDGPAVEAFSAMCRQSGFFIVAGMAEKAGKNLFNAAVLVGPEGWVGTYRKVHLFNVEKTLFDPGNTGFQVWDVAGVRIGLMICFDWIFPEAARTLALKDVDIICHPANLVLPFCQNAMITRSLENRIFTATANRIGRESRWEEPLLFTGGSQITSPAGRRLLSLSEDREELEVIDVDLSKARDKMITSRNHVLNDRRQPFYNE